MAKKSKTRTNANNPRTVRLSCSWLKVSFPTPGRESENTPRVNNSMINRAAAHRHHSLRSSRSRPPWISCRLVTEPFSFACCMLILQTGFRSPDQSMRPLSDDQALFAGRKLANCVHEWFTPASKVPTCRSGLESYTAQAQRIRDHRYGAEA